MLFTRRRFIKSKGILQFEVNLNIKPIELEGPWGERTVYIGCNNHDPQRGARYSHIFGVNVLSTI